MNLLRNLVYWLKGISEAIKMKQKNLSILLVILGVGLLGNMIADKGTIWPGEEAIRGVQDF